MRKHVTRVRAAWIAAASLALALIGAAAAPAAQQQPPPIHGVTGTVATEESRRDTKEAGRGIFSRVAKMLGLSRRPADSTNAAAEEAFNTLQAGTRVMVATADADGNPASAEVEAVIMDMNRTDFTMTIRLEDGTRQALRLNDGTSRAGDRGSVVVFATSSARERVPHHFRRIS